MLLETFIQKNRRLITWAAIVGGVFGVVLFGLWGYQYGWRSYFVNGHVADVRPGEIATIYSLLSGLIGCFSGILIGPLAIIAGYLATHYARERKINQQG